MAMRQGEAMLVEALELDRNLEPWERMPGETSAAWQAFLVYRGMLEQGAIKRSTNMVAQKLGRKQQIVSKWCTAHHWVERCAAYDRHMDFALLQEMQQRLKTVAKRHADAIGPALEGLMAPIRAYLERLERHRAQGGDAFASYSDKELASAMRQAARLLPHLIQAERLVLGLSTQNMSVQGQITHRVEGMSREELDGFLLGIEG